ncbi:MAG: hypothetical protein AB8I08_04110 [Sandaracinaceae bacterium]
MKTSTTTLALAAALLGLAWTGTASAQDADQLASPAEAADGELRGELRLGKLYSFGGGNDLQHGFGLDLRYHLFPAQNMDGFIGLFGQGQYETGEAFRFAGGLSGGWDFFGLELGMSHRTETSGYAGSTGLHVGQSLTFGPVSVGARLTIPLIDHDNGNVGAAVATQGIEGALTVRMSFGFTVHGQRPEHHCHAGTPRVNDPHQQHHGH